MKARDIFKDEAGFTTLGMTVSLLLCMALVLSSVQVYRINSASAAIQDTADACALAAETEVAEFMVVANVCDAVLLSLSLASAVSAGTGIACLCTPVTASLSAGFIETGKTFAQARNSFSKTAKSGLQAYQKALPFIAAARAASTAQSNNAQGIYDYHALAVLFPLQGEDISINDTSSTSDTLFNEIDEQAPEIKDLSEQAEQAAHEANEAKQRGYNADCGQNSSDYSMYERASSLANMGGSSNPYYSSADTWSFSVAFNRACAYYQTRLVCEAPQNASAYEQSQSAVRRIFYSYACEEMDKGYVNETQDSFDAYFPTMPRNMSQVRQTSLYTNACFPVTTTDDAFVMHGSSTCSCAAGYERLGSMQELEISASEFETCPTCEFSAQSLGKIASATSSVQTGFEYHYNLVAQAASDYEKARETLDPLTSDVKHSVSSLFDACKEYAQSAADERIHVSPPGTCGALVVVFDNSTLCPSLWKVVSQAGSLGTRVAVSAASLMEDTSEDGATVLTDILSGVSDKAKNALGPLNSALQCWSGLLEAYARGQDMVSTTIRETLDAIPFVSASGLGTWAERAFQETMGLLGLEPANLTPLKPIIANTGSVASACNTPLATKYNSLKEQASEQASALDSALSWTSSAFALQGEHISLVGESIEVTNFSPFGEQGPSFSFRVALPPRAQNILDTTLGAFRNGVKQTIENAGGLIRWR